jgi:hypothetical protein
MKRAKGKKRSKIHYALRKAKYIGWKKGMNEASMLATDELPAPEALKFKRVVAFEIKEAHWRDI